MAIVQIPQQVASSAKGAAQELKDRVGQLRAADKCWTRTAAVGSLITGAVLLAQGKRKAGITATTAGVAFILLEDPKDAKALWNSIPGYLDSGKRLLSRFEKFVEELSEQGAKLRAFLENAEL